MANVGRNDPCPCGSGKKYKRCCLALHASKDQEPHRTERFPAGQLEVQLDPDELDDLVDRLNALIRQGRLGHAEELGRELLQRFPGQLDGHEGLARVYEARGDSAKAAEHYRSAALIAERGDGYDPRLIAHVWQRARALEAPEHDPTCPSSSR
jgi:tetratricopeptide (TPR) repeat protein